MDRVNGVKPRVRSRTSSQSEGSLDEVKSTPSIHDNKKDDYLDDSNSQDDIKSEGGNNAMGVGMSLRDRSKRTRPNYRYAPEPDVPAPVERRAPARVNKSTNSTTNADVSHWLQCDACHKWRIVAHKLFEDLQKLARFECRNLQGVTCKDRDDWGASVAGGSDDISVKDDGQYRRRSRKQIKRVNIFAGKYIPGFAGEFSDFGDD